MSIASPLSGGLPTERQQGQDGILYLGGNPAECASSHAKKLWRLVDEECTQGSYEVRASSVKPDKLIMGVLKAAFPHSIFTTSTHVMTPWKRPYGRTKIEEWRPLFAICNKLCPLSQCGHTYLTSPVPDLQVRCASNLRASSPRTTMDNKYAQL